MAGRRTLSSAVVVALTLACAAPSSASIPKTDVVTLKNGTVITCEMQTLNKGQLSAKTDGFGTVSIKWDRVASVVSTRVFQVETSSGLRLFGSLAAKTPGQVEVVAQTGPVAIDLDTVVFIARIGNGFFRRIDGSLNLGTIYTQSSGVGQFDFSANATYRKPNLQLSAAASSNVTVQRDADDSARSTLQFGYERPFATRWVMFGAGGFDRNRDLGYDLRSSVGGGAGYYVVKSNRAIVSLAGGLSTSRELPIDAPSVQSLDALLAVRQSFFTYDHPKTNLSLSLQAYPGLSQLGRVRLDFNGSFSRELVENFTIGATAYDSYDNRPPTGSVTTNDVGFTLTIGWTFGAF